MSRVHLARLLGIFMALVCGCGGEGGVEIARVNDSVLTLEEIRRQIPPEYEGKVTPEQKEEFVDRWVNSEVLYQEALRRGIDEDEEVKRQLHQLTKDILVAELIERELDEMPQATPEEVQSYYQGHLEEFIREEDEVRASHILIEKEEMAKELKRKLRKGADFAHMAAEISLDEATSTRGGDLGYFTRGAMAPPIAEMAFTTAMGSIAGPVESEYGCHLILVTDKKKKGTVRDFDQVKDEIFHQLSASRQKEQLDRLLNRLRTEAMVEKHYHILWSNGAEDSLGR